MDHSDDAIGDGFMFPCVTALFVARSSRTSVSSHQVGDLINEKPPRNIGGEPCLPIVDDRCS